MKEQKLQKKLKYTAPKIKRLGKLNVLIQGVTGNRKDAFPQPGTRA